MDVRKWLVSVLGLYLGLSIDAFSPLLMAADELPEVRDAQALFAIPSEDTNRQLSSLKAGLFSHDMDMPELQRRYAAVVQNTTQLSSLMNVVFDSLAGALAGGLAGMSPGGVGLGFIGGAVGFGLKEAVQAIHEAITHEKRNRALVIAFDDAISKYRVVRKWIASVESQMDGHLYLLKLVQASGGRESFLVQTRKLVWDQQLQLTTIREMVDHAYKGTGVDPSLLSSLEVLGSNLQSVLKKTENLQSLVDSVTDTASCDALQEKMRMVFDGEALLQDQRIPLLSATGERVWFDAWDKTYRSHLGALSGYSPEFQKKRLQEEQELIERNFNEQIKADSELYKKISSAKKKCLHDLTRLPQVLTFLALPSQKRQCWAEVTRPMSRYADAYLDQLSDLDRLRSHLLAQVEIRRSGLEKVRSMRPSSEYYENAMKRYFLFFDQLAYEQDSTFIDKRMKHLEDKQAEIYAICKSTVPGAI